MDIRLTEETLTAYALGELEPERVAQVEEALRDNEDARRMVAELKSTAKLMAESGFPAADLSLSEAQREAIAAEAEAPGNVLPMEPRTTWRTWAAVAATLVVLGTVGFAALPKVREMARISPDWMAQKAALSAEDQATVDRWVAGMHERGYAEDSIQRFYIPDPNDKNWQKRQQLTQIAREQAMEEGVPYERQKAEEVAQSPAAPPPSAAPQGGLQNVELNGPIRIRGNFYAMGDIPGVAEAMTRRGVNGVLLYEEMAPQAGAQIRDLVDSHPASPYDDPNQNYWPGHNTEAYDAIVENEFLAVAQNPLSTFSIDVDTASYANMRRFLSQSTLPPPDAIRIEELVNYFDYDYAPPRDLEAAPFASHVTVAGCPWAPAHRLVRVGLKGWEMPPEARPASNLVFLIDVSGSMGPQNKLPLLKQAMKLLVQQLDERDKVAMVVYAGSSGLVLPSTNGDDKHAILGALERLQSGGSTNGGQGIELAYRTAVSNYIEGGVNRVILATDGDFNVGVTNRGDLTGMIEKKAKSGVFLTILGFGMGNVKDANLEELSNKGNGNYAYIDTLNEAKKVLVDEMGANLVTIAKDVKIQVEFNPAEVQAYRLIGYENRSLAAEDFNDDTKDAGEIGAGHTVTALYEVVPAGAAHTPRSVDPLKYQQPRTEPSAAARTGEIMTLKLRYKAPDGDTSKLLEFPVTDPGMGYAQAEPDFKFAASVASFGMLLRGSKFAGAANFDTVLELAEEGRGEDPHGYRAEFIELVKAAKRLKAME